MISVSTKMIVIMIFGIIKQTYLDLSDTTVPLDSHQGVVMLFLYFSIVLTLRLPSCKLGLARD